jgi:acyl-CoA thioester hydrolase
MIERFAIDIRPVPDDIDELGHVSNLVYLRWVAEVAMAHSVSVGWDVARYRESGAVFMVRRHEIDYVAQVTLGQQLRAETWVDSWKLASCVRKTEIVIDGRGLPPAVGTAEGRRGLVDGQVVARAATTWAMIGLASGRPQRIPEPLAVLFRGPA